MLISVENRDGDHAGYTLRSVMDYCRASLEARGFEARGFSNVSESVYFTRPGIDGELRVAFHSNGRGHYAADLALPRADVWTDEGREPALPYPYDAGDLDEMIAAAIVEFEDNAELDSDGDE